MTYADAFEVEFSMTVEFDDGGVDGSLCTNANTEVYDD